MPNMYSNEPMPRDTRANSRCVDDQSADILTYIKKANCLLSPLWPQTLHLCRSFVASLVPPLVDGKMVLRLTPEVIEFDSMRHHGGSIFERHPGVNCGAYCGVLCGAAAGGKKQEFTIFESPPVGCHLSLDIRGSRLRQ